MMLRVIHALFAALAVVGFGVTADSIERPVQCSRSLERDVVIVGGGASGSYAAVQLRKDHNKSVAVIELKEYLGGHVGTYVDPITSTLVNYGIMVYNNYGNAMKFMHQMNVETGRQVAYAYRPKTVYVDPYTGKEIQNYTGPIFPEVLAGMAKLNAVIKQYENFLIPGYWNFPAGKDIPADLLLPWGQFVEKYGLQDIFWILKTIAGPCGKVDWPAAFVIFNFNTVVIEGFFKKTSFDPNPFDMRILYKKVRNYLGQDAMVSTKVLETERTDKGVMLIAQGADGHKTCISAKQLLIAAQPSLKNLETLDLDAEEKALFGAWATIGNFVFIVRANFIPYDRQVQYMSATPTDLPFNLNIEHTLAPNLYRVVFNSQRHFYSIDTARLTISKYLNNMMRSGLFNTTTTPTFSIVDEVDYTSVQYNQTSESLKAGFMQRLYAVQGKRSTWYTGGLWSSDYTANVWSFTDTVLDRLLRA